jgi:glycosyltransferase involved in cell wall biosynthesis
MRTLERFEVAQVATAGTEPRAPVLEWNDRLDLLLHALAQLPDAVTLEVEAPRTELGALQLLARAYAIEDRAKFQESGVGRRGTLFRPNLPASVAMEPGCAIAELVERLSRSDDPAVLTRASDEVLTHQRIAIVTNLPAHYRLPLFAHMARRLNAVGAAFRVFFLAAEDSSRSWLASSPTSFDYEFIPSLKLPIRARPPLFPLTLESRLARFEPTIVVAGGFSPFVAERVARFCNRRSISHGIWSGETQRAATAHSGIRHAHRISLVRRANFAIAYGFAAAEYLRHLRPDLPLVHGRNTAPIPRGRPAPASTSRLEVLAVGDLASPRKGVDIAIDALALCPNLACRLSIVGGGSLMRELTDRAVRDARIRFLGPLHPAEVHSKYLAADVVLFPTRFDVFGLALVEGMGAGAATVVSRAAGAVADLALDGENCLVVDGHDPEAWAESLRRVVSDAELRRSLGRNGRRTIERRWTIAHAAEAMIAGLRLAVLQAQDARANGE